MAKQGDAEVPGIRLRGLRKEFGPVVAVDDLDLDIADGEFFAVLGPSGSGKTTVLRMIAGFETPTAGTVELGGADATRQPPFRRDVNTVFQDYALFPHMNVAAERRVRAAGQARAAGRTGAAGPRGARTVRLERLGAAPAGAAVRRPAPTRRAGPRPGQPPARAAARRTARRARSQTARADAGRTQGDPARGRHHLRLRHPRPGRGAHPVRPAGRDARRDASNRSAPRPRSTSRRRRGSSPSSSARPTSSAVRGARGPRPGRDVRGPSGEDPHRRPAARTTCAADDARSAKSSTPDRDARRRRRPRGRADCRSTVPNDRRSTCPGSSVATRARVLDRAAACRELDVPPEMEESA